MRLKLTLRNTGLSLGTALILSACGISEEADGAPSGDHIAMAASATAFTADDLPGCAVVASAVGAPIADMGLLPSDRPAAWDDGDKFGLTCTWGNDQSVRAAAGEVLGPQGIAEIGGISLQIVVSAGGLTKVDAKPIGMAFEDRRADAIGAWIMANHELDLGSSLTAVAPQVIVGDISVAFASTGAMLNTPKNLSGVTNDWAIANAVRVHQMLKQPRGR